MTTAVGRVQANPSSSDKAQAIAGHVRAKQFAAFIKGKRCIVVGPAGYLAGQGRGEWIDSHDVVVKMNWGETLDGADYGQRTDVLYKRLLKLGHADDILVQEYVDAGLQWLVGVGTRPHDKGIGYLQDVVGDRLPWFVDDSTRAGLRRELGTSPLLGMVTIKHLLAHGAASVAVTGCDFYRTGYASEYGGQRYRRFMKRGEGTLGQRHDGPVQLRWLARLHDTDPRVTFDQELSALVQPVPRPRRTKRAASPPPHAARFVWTPRNVTTRRLPAMSLRTYVEQRMLRAIIEPLGRLRSAAEVGAGFGRMTIALTDHADAVTAFEREPELAKVAARLLPAVNVVHVPALTALPAADGAFDLVMTFTVLQHMDHAAVAQVTAEMKRLSARYCLVVEDTDPDHVYIDGKDRTHFTLGRSVEEYQHLLAPFELIRSEPREVEAGFSYQGKPRPYVGHYMLFERRAA